MSDLETINANLRREIEEARANANGLRAVISGVSDERDNALKELAIHDAEDVDVERGFNAAKAIIARLSAVIEEARARLERDIQDTTAELVILEGHPNATDGQIGRCAAKRSEAKDLLAILAKAEEGA
jgi:chromosome segregation ATPase